ncbi:MAG: alcohol dehydrogenase catalytic domain-containing protein, partial [Defluviitaleaceae bacterium]|nr:alcohol dehydrogenase catalytic domain-containing protein [Defluviitaleaceae bacterium]
MKAAVLYANDDIRYADWETPAAGPGEVVVKVFYTGICRSDVPRVLENGAHFYPVVLGHEFAGEITEVGPGVAGFAPGDRVTGAPLIPCMKCADCQRGDYSLCKNYSFIGSRQQ